MEKAKAVHRTSGAAVYGWYDWDNTLWDEPIRTDEDGPHLNLDNYTITRPLVYFLGEKVDVILEPHRPAAIRRFVGENAWQIVTVDDGGVFGIWEKPAHSLRPHVPTRKVTVELTEEEEQRLVTVQRPTTMPCGGICDILNKLAAAVKEAHNG